MAALPAERHLDLAEDEFREVIAKGRSQAYFMTAFSRTVALIVFGIVNQLPAVVLARADRSPRANSPTRSPTSCWPASRQGDSS